jgi:hypothetical protein
MFFKLCFKLSMRYFFKFLIFFKGANVICIKEGEWHKIYKSGGCFLIGLLYLELNIISKRWKGL